MKTSILIIFIFITNYCQGQGGLTGWDQNYKFTNAEAIIQAEREYAHKVERDTAEAQYYVSMQKFRFIAKYTGNERPIDAEVLQSMRNVLKLKMGSSEVLNGLVSREFEFDTGKSKIWMPVQNQLIDDLNHELNPGDKVLLYCLLTNEHKYKGDLINTFLVSEFLSDCE
jgi:hypothetical protein